MTWTAVATPTTVTLALSIELTMLSLSRDRTRIAAVVAIVSCTAATEKILECAVLTELHYLVVHLGAGDMVGSAF